MNSEGHVDEPTVLWRLFGMMMDVKATTWAARDSWVLRIDQGEELVEMQNFDDRKALVERSQNVYSQLVAQGWKPRM
jgi:hypothetical protein